MRLEVNNLNYSYNNYSFLDKISFSLDKGIILSIVGPNGSGKTTILKCISKVLRLKKGTVSFDGKSIKNLSLKEISRYVSFVPQNFFPVFATTVFEMVLLGRKPYVKWFVSGKDEEIVKNILDIMGLGNLSLRFFNELSGGEKQKVLIAKALAQEPEIILLDEPTSNLDLKHQFKIMNLIKKIIKQKNISAVMAIHDLNLALRFSDKIIMLKDGMVHAYGDIDKILNEENIKKVFGIDTIIYKHSGISYIIPVED